MEQTKRFSNKKLAIIGAFVVVVIIVIVVIVFTPRNNNEPTKSKVEPGETITSDQIKKENLDKSTPGPQSGGTPQQTPTNTDFYNVIEQSNKVAPDSSGKVNFGIIKTVSPLPGWYVVTIKSDGIEPAKVIFEQTSNPNNPLTIVAGPGTDFPSEYISLPDAVRKALK